MRGASFLVAVLLGCAEPKGMIGAPTPAASSASSVDPSSSIAPTPTVSTTVSASPPSTPAAKYPPKTGYLMREDDGRCLYRPHLYYCPPGAMCKPLPEPEAVICPRLLAGPPGKIEKLPAVEGFLERHVDGSCWWAKEVPAECIAGTPCPPMPVAKQVECHP